MAERVSPDHPLKPLFAASATTSSLASFGLGEVRKGWQRRAPGSFERSRSLWRR